MKPGTYAVAVVDDQNGDRKLNKDFFGIPKEGFGISKNPTVSIQTGTPKFRDASFVVNKNTTVNIIHEIFAGFLKVMWGVGKRRTGVQR